MPYTGYDPYGGLPQGGAIDASGGGMDPSYYYALSPGGRFPGDSQNFFEYLAAQSTGANQGNPDYQLPAWMSRIANIVPGRAGNMLERGLSAHERNVQSPGSGQTPTDPSAGYPYQTFSGPGAPYGPANGPGTGLIDYDRPVGQNWDGPEYRPPGGGDAAPAGGGRGGGGGKPRQTFNYTPYQGMNYQSHFVDNQPISPFTPGPYSPTRMVEGNKAPSQSAAPSIPATGPRAPAAGRGTGGGGSGTGAGVSRPGVGTGSRPGSTPAGLPPVRGTSPSPGDPWVPGAMGTHIGETLRGNTFGGVNTNALERGTPGWQDDPTAGIYDTSGFPGSTLSAPRHGESFEAYMTRLHDDGMSSDDIFSALGRYGFSPNQGSSMGPHQPGDPGAGDDWEWNWGMGPVTRGEYGYDFARNSFGGAGSSTGRPSTDFGQEAYAMDSNGNRIRVDFGARGFGNSAGSSGGGAGAGSGQGSSSSSGAEALATLLTPLIPRI